MMFRVVFWVILPCKIIVDRRFRGAYCLHHQGRIKRKYIIHPFMSTFFFQEQKLAQINILFLDRRLVWLWWGMLMPIGMPC
jgi:hypothetical protein